MQSNRHRISIFVTHFLEKNLQSQILFDKVLNFNFKICDFLIFKFSN